MSENTIIALHKGFPTTEEAIQKVEAAMATQFHPIRRETKENVRNFNKKCRSTTCH